MRACALATLTFWSERGRFARAAALSEVVAPLPSDVSPSCSRRLLTACVARVLRLSDGLMRSQSLSEGVHFEWPLVSPPGLMSIEFGVGFVVVREAPPIVVFRLVS